MLVVQPYKHFFLVILCKIMRERECADYVYISKYVQGTIMTALISMLPHCGAILWSDHIDVHHFLRLIFLSQYSWSTCTRLRLHIFKEIRSLAEKCARWFYAETKWSPYINKKIYQSIFFCQIDCTENLLNLVLYNLPHQMKTIQLINHESVPCCWSIAEVVKPFKKVKQFCGNFTELFRLIL